MNNERMKLEQKLLEDENAQLKRWIILTVIVALVLILAIVVWEYRRRIKRLKKENERLEKERKQVEKAREGLRHEE